VQSAVEHEIQLSRLKAAATLGPVQFPVLFPSYGLDFKALKTASDMLSN
jgi:hypothetical protein